MLLLLCLMSREKNVIIQICSYVGVGYPKIQYSSVQRKKSHHIELDGKSIGLHVNQISQSNTFYYAQYPDFLKGIQILACSY